MLQKILILVVLSISAVVSIVDPTYFEKSKPYRRDPYIARELQRHQHRHTSSYRPDNQPRLSAESYQQGENVEQQERHANSGRPGRDYANNIDEYYGGCPSGFTGQLPYPYDCRRFVNCWKGRAFIQTCGPGTVFNGETRECDHPTKVVCQGLNALPRTNRELSTSRLARQQAPASNAISCPRGHTGLMPHPGDCSKFLNCASGSTHVMNCAPQTLFDPATNVCDFAHKVDCSGRDGGSYSSPSAPPASGNRDRKTIGTNTRVNQQVPQRKGGPTSNAPQDHGFQPGYPSHRPPPSGSFAHHDNNCTEENHNHGQVFPQRPIQPDAQPDTQTPIYVRNRWENMNRTRPTSPTWQPPALNPAPIDRSWTTRPTTTTTTQRPSRWRPIPETSTTPQPTWSAHGSSGGAWTTPRPSSNYPNTNYGNTHTTPTNTTTTIYYAQPVDDDQPSEEVFSNVYGGDVSEVSLPSNRQNASRGVNFPRPSHPSMDTVNIPNPNLMPPHPFFASDDRQSPIPEQFPDYSSPYPSYVAPQQPRPNSFNRENPWLSPEHPKMDAMDIPSRNLMPPHRSFPPDDGQSRIPEQYPDYSTPYPSYSPPPQPIPRPGSYNRTTVFISPSPEDGHTTIDAINFPNHTPHQSSNWPSLVSPEPHPSFSLPQPSYPSGSGRFNTTTIFIPTTTPPPIFDESNLFGGLLPPLPSDPESSSPPREGTDFIHLLPPPQNPIPVPTSTTPLPGVKTNVRTFQIYPIPTVRNAEPRSFVNPVYSSPYAGVAHSRDTNWPPFRNSYHNRVTPTPRHMTSTFAPQDNFDPEIIFSHDGGVVVANREISTTTERHGVSPPNYNREFYKQTTPSSVYRAPPPDTDTSDEVGQLPVSEAIRLLLRPYFNRSGTVTEDMAAKAESHIMNLSRSPKEPTTSKITTTTTTTTTSTVAPPPEIDKDVEIVFAGEQNSLTPNRIHPIHSHAHNHQNHFHHHHHHHQQPPFNYDHPHQHHSRDFHQQHPHLPNPFEHENELGEEDDSVLELTTARTTTEVSKDPAVADVCEFDCGNGKCVKGFETCDGINNCGNRRDEEQCDHLGYDIRLSNENGGRVEVKILGQWGYVCDDKFGIQDANVVCRELGFPLGASEVRGNSFYPPADGEEVSFVMDEVDCSGNETSLKDCPFMGWGVSDCGPDEVVGVQCKTPVMKCPNDYWLCSTSKECIPPAFVCDNVPDCSDQSDESSAVCNSTVEFRLKGGRSKQEGRLEVLYRGVWGTVCDDDFGLTEAQVACNSLGYYGVAKIVKNAFGPGSGPIWLDQVSCFGNESTIDTCNHWSWGEHNCNHTEDVSLKCTPGSAPRPTNTGVKGGSRSTDDVENPILDDIGMDLYPMERSSKFKNTRKVCGHFNANLTEELPREFERVVRGNVAKRGHHPWQATIRTKGRGGISSHWCGAVLISKKHLLTAAHCLVGYPKGAYFIRLGDHYANIAESSEIDSYIENWYIHEKFRDGTHMNNDIALIVMKNPVRFNDYIQPICLPREGTEYEEGRRCMISGWGSIQSGVSTPSNNLRVAEIPVISDEVCKLPHVYGNSITEGMFCAGFLEEGVDACEGDSGGPFVCSDSDAETLYGIISWGQQCGHANKPGVYVKIEKYLDWIYEKIRFSMQQTI